ncbi:MAG TPA: replicative DNA helicase [Opitutus sp.]|nr:replicative DNA helicase [Opitutus sp.]
MAELSAKPNAVENGIALTGLFGREMPHSFEAEEYLLACCFIDGAETMSRCQEEKMEAEAFFAPANRIIFTKLLDLVVQSKPIDIAVVAEELRAEGKLDDIGGYAYLVQVSSRIPTTAQAGYFIERVRNLYLLRRLIQTVAGIAQESFHALNEVDQFFDKAETAFFKITQNRVSESAQQMRGPTNEAMNVITKMMMKKGEMTGVTSGFKDLDALTWGFQRQEMIVLAARPSMGKTSLALNFAEAAGLPKRGEPAPVLIFSLEMSAAQLALRMLCSRARVNMKLLRDGLLSKNGEEQNRLVSAADEFSKAPLFIDDSSALSIMQLRAKARRIHARTPLGFIMVDYLQLLSPTDPKVPREQQVAEASRGLKSLAKELNVPVLVLSQLNRSSEKENRTPKLADLRESGSIEQDADVVLMLARPKDADEKFQVAADSAELIVAKQRNGPVGELKLTFLRDYTRFENFTQ